MRRVIAVLSAAAFSTLAYAVSGIWWSFILAPAGFIVGYALVDSFDFLSTAHEVTPAALGAIAFLLPLMGAIVIAAIMVAGA